MSTESNGLTPPMVRRRNPSNGFHYWEKMTPMEAAAWRLGPLPEGLEFSDSPAPGREAYSSRHIKRRNDSSRVSQFEDEEDFW